MSLFRLSTLGLAALTLSACISPTTPATAPDLAPPIPRDDRPKAEFTAITGINSDAVAALSGDARQSVIYYDLFAADKAAVAAAPARLCGHYGRALKDSHVTEPGDRVPGMKALVVRCN
ncbi:hypothetical protein [Rhodobacter maris]|uniref:Lipoprotein n=1 Tax=Rhodobacter maris TaxID=446682 RepID=A0A285RJK5_9RHOB|nr:hypothetical protein [Rhodobacter maris]SOB94305.1 hypothetical protein SAMN05877831_101383 [Rhodobacter maris]